MSSAVDDPTSRLAERTDGAIRLPLLLCLALLGALAPIATDLYLPGFPAIATDLGGDASGVQLTLTSFLVGLALGQLVMGPLSDRFGRRPPLVVSAVVCVVAGAVSALAPNLGVLVGARLVQGIAGAGGMVIGRAVVADLASGRAAAKAFTVMITVGGVAPVLAPLAGSLLAGPVGWRGMLWAVTGLCVLMLAAVLAGVPETHPRGSAATGTPYADGVRRLLRHRAYWSHTAVVACSFGVMMAYISSSPFVYQRVLGLSEVEYGVAFGLNAAGLIATGAVVSRLVDRIEPTRIIAGSLCLQVGATLALLLLVVVDAPAWTLAVAIFWAVLSNGGTIGTSAALAMSHVRDVAGTGSAFLGFSQFALGALVSPLVGLGGDGSALAPAVVMAIASLCAATAQLSSRSTSMSTATS
ncbi:multidrug effflux MFS transporter [Nocardioides sp. LS1]|uniref:multidrug effflux MFS transporter n=1 Tax=Nocardioides sp. LS1 TaxID=1027620 RepID=UPI000FFA8337|nr:multidrug effflux MFS transporter [Nocardioides sp. LS1]GCD89935.1 Bcr/CflA family drug resistance efflux transporter [Nocardioides sp. LS1]